MSRPINCSFLYLVSCIGLHWFYVVMKAMVFNDTFYSTNNVMHVVHYTCIQVTIIQLYILLIVSYGEYTHEIKRILLKKEIKYQQ